MRLNEHEAIATANILLVPYSECHVQTYHRWMEDEELRILTASERLSLSEEHAMQQSWRQDHDKLTFIVCLPASGDEFTTTEADSIRGTDTPDRMIGDVNLFLDWTEADEDTTTPESLVGEIELMIACKDLHRRGHGRAALLSFMEYVLQNWSDIAAEFCAGSRHPGKLVTGIDLTYLRARISSINETSIRLFRSVGFVQHGDGPNYFGEVELRWIPNLDELRSLKWYQKPRRLQYK